MPYTDKDRWITLGAAKDGASTDKTDMSGDTDPTDQEENFWRRHKVATIVGGVVVSTAAIVASASAAKIAFLDHGNVIVTSSTGSLKPKGHTNGPDRATASFDRDDLLTAGEPASGSLQVDYVRSFWSNPFARTNIQVPPQQSDTVTIDNSQITGVHEGPRPNVTPTGDGKLG